nr:hypothetical protein CcurKRNrm2_p047 [Cryptomonas curvata]
MLLFSFSIYPTYKPKIHLPYTSQPKFHIPFFIIQFFKSRPELLKNIYQTNRSFLKYHWGQFKIRNFFKKKTTLKKNYSNYFFKLNFKKKKYQEIEIKCILAKYLRKNLYYYYNKNKKKINVSNLLSLYIYKNSSSLINFSFKKSWIFFKFSFRFFFKPLEKFSNIFIYNFAKKVEIINNYNK